MQIDPTEQARLLELAAFDKNLNQLRHQRATLPALKVIEDAEGELAGSRGDLVDAETTRADLGRQMSRLESDIDGVRARIERNQQRLDTGAVRDPKDVQAMTHEMETLRRRQGSLEDDELELMEQAEQAENRIAEITEQRSSVESRRDEAIAERDRQQAELDEQTSGVQQQREALAGQIDEQLVALYDKIRASGVPGAALLSQRRCGGCRLELAGSELAAVRAAAPQDVVRCESCRCILVRTGESGL